MTRRVWTEATPVQTGPAWHIALDGKPLRLPSGATLHLPTAALAQAVAVEWQTAPPSFSPDAIPLTQLAAAAQDRIAPQPAPVVHRLAAYAQADLLCYRAAYPADLAAAQQAQWQPWLDWAESALGARLHTTTGIAAVTQPPASLTALHQAVAASPIPHLAALDVIIPALGSCILGLAVAAGALPPETAATTAELDALHQQSLWGADPDLASRLHRLQTNVTLAVRFMDLSTPDGAAPR